VDIGISHAFSSWTVVCSRSAVVCFFFPLLAFVWLALSLDLYVRYSAFSALVLKKEDGLVTRLKIITG